MIACVSAIEYNIGETLNTIKYASRARNIRNAAKINAAESGWDDVEHLQNTVLRLRKQLKSIEADEEHGVFKGGREQNEEAMQRLVQIKQDHTEVIDYPQRVQLTESADVRSVSGEVSREIANPQRAMQDSTR